MASKQYHVMMFPWLAFGHMIPSLEFSKRLAAKGVRISFVSTPRNIQRLPSVPSDLATQIKLVEIHLPPVDGLPHNCEATVDLQQSEIQYMKKACDSLQDSFEKLLHEDLPDFVLFDFVQCWIPETASKFGVPSAYLSAFSASSLAFIGPPNELKPSSHRTKPEDFTVAPEWFPFPSLIAHRPDQAAIMFRNLNFPDESGLSSGQRFAKTLEGCDFVAVRSCREIEGAYLNLLEELYKKPVLPIGVLPPFLAANKSSHPNFSNIFKWLDKQVTKSVVFVGFGTEYKMPIKEVQELALGIELSELPYIWILRKTGVDSSDMLPNGFLARTSNHGMVCFGWAPQCEMLAHPAIGGCLFHSGWGSVIETLSFGHPQILMPMVADQGLVAKLLVEKGIGFEVKRNEKGSFSRDAVAMSLRRVMVEQEGRRLRSEAAKMPSIFAKQDLQDDYTSKFVDFLSNYKIKKP